MPTKRELLEEKTVKELKQMARDKDLSGYSGMRKAELVDMVNANYTKADIKAWPEPAEKPEEVEEEVEIEMPEPEEGLGEVTEEKVEAEDEAFKQVVIGIIIGIIVIIVILGLMGAGII